MKMTDIWVNLSIFYQQNVYARSKKRANLPVKNAR